VSLEGLTFLGLGFKGRSAAWVSGAVALFCAAFTAAGCSSSFGSGNCEDTLTCAPSQGGSASGSGGTGGGAGEPSEPPGGADAGGASGAGGDAGGATSACEAGQQACDGECIDTRSNPDHCGGCETACRTGSICAAGACKPCPSPQLGCNGRCIDPKKDAEYCGASADCREDRSGAICADSEVCSDGACLSDDASLEALSLDPTTLAPAFSPETLAYTAKYSYFEPRLTLTATPAAVDATLSYAGEELTVDAGVEIVSTPEANVPKVSVEVTAPSGKLRSYDITLERGALVTTYVKAFNSRAGFGFGTSVAIDGDTAVFGAPFENSSGFGVDGNETSTGSANAGAAYVAIRGADGKWARQAYLKAGDAAHVDDEFGRSVAVDGDTVAVGAPGFDAHAGAVHLFTRAGSTWSYQATLTEPLPDQGNRFGEHVALQGDRLIVAAPASDAIKYLGGAAYSYTRSGTTWKADDKHPVPPSEDLFSYGLYGSRLALSGDRVAVGEQYGAPNLFVLLRSGSNWNREQDVPLPSGVEPNAALALDGDRLAVSAPGVVHVFARSDSTWTKQASLTPFNAGATTGFGASLAMKDGLLAVGSGCETCSGAVSTFVRNGESWTNGSFVTAKNLEANDRLGFAVAVSGNRVVAGATGEDSNAASFNQSSANNSALESGAAFIFE
jgi:hypothetical protein